LVGLLKEKSRHKDGFFVTRSRITSSLPFLALLQEQQQVLQQQEQQQVLQQQVQQQQALQQELALQLLLSYRRQPEPEPTGKRSATIFS
jgi:hypothetical protein